MYFKPPTPSDNPANPFYHPMNAKFVHTEEVEQVDEMSPFNVMGGKKTATPRKMGRDLENRLKMTKPSEYTFSAPAAGGGTFAVIPVNMERPSMLSQAGVMMATFDKRGKVLAYYGTHMNTDAAKKFAKKEGLIESVQLDEGTMNFLFDSPMKAGAFAKRVMRDKLASEVDRYVDHGKRKEVVELITHPNNYEKNDILKLAKQYKGTVHSVEEDVQLDENVQNQVKRMDRRAKQRLAKKLNDLDLSGYGDYEARVDNVHKFKSSDLKMAMQMLKMNEEEQMNEEKKFKARIAFMGEPKDNARDMRAAGRMKMYDTATERNVPSKRKSTVFDITFKSERQFNQFMGAYDVEFLDRLDESRDDFDYLDVQAAMQDAKLEAPKVVKTRQGYQVMVFSRKLRKHIPQGPPHRSKSAAEKDAKMFEDVQLDEATPGDTRVVTKGDQNQYERISRALTAAKKAGKIAGYEGTVFNRSKGEVTLIFDTKAHKPASERRKVAKMIKDFGLEFNHSVEEGFASDAQRRAAFASGYKAKGKKKNEEEEIKEGLRQAMSAPRETPAQKRKRQEKDNFDLYKKRQKRISALRGDKSSRKLTPKQQRDYLRRVNLDQIRAMEEVEVNEEKGTYSSMNRRGIDKPLLAYIAALDDELKKMGMKYSDKKVDPVIVMKAYNANKSPKEAAKMFKK